jgi:uncharacterized protein YbjT (DUF2867 family)
MAKRILVLGVGGLIGGFVADDLTQRGHTVIAVARRFSAAQRERLGETYEMAATTLDIGALSQLLRDSQAEIVVNCIGILQDAPGESTRDVHHAFVEKLTAAIRSATQPMLLVHLSIPGVSGDDRSSFAVSKRAAETVIANSSIAYAILRPGFVFAPVAYGGSAMLRAVAMLPLDLPDQIAARPFAVVAIEDIAETVALLAQRWRVEDAKLAVSWDLMHPAAGTIGSAVASLRRWLGSATQARPRLPLPLLRLGALAGDAVALLGWRPPIRSTALAELERGVVGDPRSWLTATGITPRALDDILKARPATVQEKWFARLYALKALIVAILTVFWCASGLIALTVAYPAAVAILTTHGFAETQAHIVTVVSSLLDISVGVAIAVRRSHRGGLIAGIVVSLSYMLAAALLTPDMWIEPLGALVKTFPAIVLMLVALAIADDR